MREHIGYEIIRSEIYDIDWENDITFEIVLGWQESTSQYVTWECKNRNDYFWGHYFIDPIGAYIDYHDRLVSNYKALYNKPF